jgi:DNA-binding transcriptional LysR family regulator
MYDSIQRLDWAIADMDLKRMRHLVTLADERNFARAAGRVHLSQPAFSRSVQAAEAELGLRLFDRGGTEVKCTAAGAFVIERARKLLFDSSCLDRDVDLYRQGQAGEIAFGVGPFPAATLLPRLMIELRKRHAGVQVRVEVNNWQYLVEHLHDEEIDLFVADSRDVPRDAGLTITPLARQSGSFYCRAGHPLLGEKDLRAQALLPYGLASVRLPKAVVEQFAALLGVPPGQNLPLAMECDDVATLKRVAMATDTVLGCTHAAVAAELAAGTLVQLPLRGLPPLYAQMGLVALAGRSHSPVAQFVVDQFQALARETGA